MPTQIQDVPKDNRPAAVPSIRKLLPLSLAAVPLVAAAAVASVAVSAWRGDEPAIGPLPTATFPEDAEALRIALQPLPDSS